MCDLSESAANNIRKYLKNKLINKVCEVSDHENEREELLNLLRATVSMGESNSALILGPPGVGKTTLVKDVLEELKLKKDFSENVIIVYLNGLVHTDDKLALKSCTIQMGLENAVDGKVFGSFAENLSFLLASLKSGSKEASKSVIFILEELDMFCSHYKQTLLYNLFDASQSKQTPICVLGLTSRLDVIEMFEKRVKSRFSHRQIFLHPKLQDTKQKNFQRHYGNVSDQLSITDELTPNAIGISVAVKKRWNKHVEKFLAQAKVKKIFERLFKLDLNKSTLRVFLVELVLNLSVDNPELTLEDLERQMAVFEQDDKVAYIEGLSVLELCLVIAMQHHTEIFDEKLFNFEMILARLQRFVRTVSSMQTVQRPTVLKAFEHLKNLEFITPASSFGHLKEYQMFRLNLIRDEIQQAVKNCQGLPTEVQRWAQSSLAS